MALKPRWVSLVKLLVHGAVLTAAVWVFGVILALLIIGPLVAASFGLGPAGFLLVSVITMVLSFFLEGFANALVTRWLWFPVRGGLAAYTGHGLLLGVALAVIQSLPLFFVLPYLQALGPGNYALATSLLTVIYLPIDGFVGRSIARIWETPEHREVVLTREARLREPPEPTENNPSGLRCPRCGGTRLVVASDGSAYCIACKRGIPNVGRTTSSP